MGRLRPKEILLAFETREGAYTFGPYGRANPYWSEMVAEKAAMARLLGVLSRLGRPALLVQCDGQVEATNEAADKLLGDGIAVVHHRLRSSVSREQGRLDQLVSQALAPDHSRDATEQIALSRPNGRKPIIAQVIPLGLFHPQTVDLLRSPAGLVLLVITDPDQPLGSNAVARLRLLGLTGSEARVGASVGAGLSPEVTAQNLGMTRNSVRTSLQHIYSKLDISRQSELALIAARLESGSETAPSAM